MQTSKDHAYPDTPIWQTYVDVDEYAKNHPNQILVTAKQWFQNEYLGSLKKDTFSRFLAKNMNYKQWIDAFLKTRPRHPLTYLAYHIDRVPEEKVNDLTVTHIFAVEEKDFVQWLEQHDVYIVAHPDIENSDAKHSETKEPYILELVFSQRPTKMCNTQTATKLEWPVTLLDKSKEHAWIHRVQQETTTDNRFLDHELYCLTIEPTHIAEVMGHLIPYLDKERFIPTIQQRLQTPSNDLTKEQNNYRLLAATLLTSVTPENLKQVIRLIQDEKQIM